MRSTQKNTTVRKLKRSLGCIDVFVYVFNSIIGAGIYASSGLVARYTNNMGTSLIIWTISGIVCLLGSLCFCELAVAFRKTGNQYLFIKETYGDLAGFCSIWAQTFIISVTGIAVVSVTMGEHCVEMFTDISSEKGQWLVRIIAVTFIFISFLINCISSAFTAKAQSVLGAIQILGMLFFICIGIWNVSTGETENFKKIFTNKSNRSMDINDLSLAFISALFPYDGWGGTVSLNEELRDVNRNLRFGIITGMPFVIMCLLVFNLTLLSKLTFMEMGRSVTVATAFIEKSIGPKYSVIVPIIVVISCFGSLNTSFLSGSRSILSASREGQLPQPLSYIHTERCTPIPALLFLLLLSVLWILALGSGLVNLLTYFSLAIWLCYGTAIFGVIVLRIRRPEMERPYKVWLIYPIITSIISCYIIVAPFFKRPIDCIICLCIILTAVPVHYLVLNYIPDSVNSRKSRLYRWILDHFPLAECVFDKTPIDTTPLLIENHF